MAFKLKLVVAAAVAAISFSGTASAISTQAGGELFLIANHYSATGDAKGGFIAALGTSVDDFSNSSVTNPFNLSGTAWTTFMDNKGTNVSTRYSVIGIDLDTSTLLTTIDPRGNGVSHTSNSSLAKLFNDTVQDNGGGLDQFVNFYNAALTGKNGFSAATSTIYYASGDSGNPSDLGTSIYGNVLFNTSKEFGASVATANTALSFYKISTNGSDIGADVTATDFNYVWTLSSLGSLAYTVAAVPEADTSAMLIAGLGMMGFIARRRKSV